MLKDFQRLQSKAQIYILAVVAAGTLAISHSVYQLVVNPIGYRWVILAALTLLTGSFNVKVTSINARISVSEAFVFAAVLLFGTPAGTATVVLECMVILLWMKREKRVLHRVLFNMAAPSLAVWTAGTAFYLLSGIQPYSREITPLPQLFLPLLAFTALYFLVNSWLVAIAVGLEKHAPVNQIWLKNFAWLAVNYFSGASLAALIVTYTKELDLSTLAVIIPLLVVSYLTFRTAMGRAEDSYSHLEELNRLYLSTIETLAMAIDAKDQITHGHIRRVQAYAVGLAKRIGVADERLLKAIEAAALLHDMGKLAVPEYILNKPGKLTAAEFEKMKLHATVGADILSAIDFPYPVVPIVRHHHENWDGTGYPTGIRGTDIPIGARILSVVDCFDALTSDRPYRTALSDEAAIDILLSRRGSMYDPLVVDTFIRVHKEIAPEQPNLLTGNTAIRELAAPLALPEPKEQHAFTERSTPSELQAVVALQQALAHPRNFADVAELVGKHLRAVVPFSVSILYLYDVERDQLVARHVTGDDQGKIRELRLSLGERLSGWVAANRKTIVNSDPVLDLGELAKSFSTGLKATLSVPLVVDTELVGVLALYSSNTSFSDEHRRIAESASLHIARSLKQTPKGEEERDPLTGLPLTTTLPQLLGTLSDRSVSLLFVDVVKLSEINNEHGRVAGDQALIHVAERVQQCLHTSDVLYKHAGDELVVLLGTGDAVATTATARRIRTAVQRDPALQVSGRAIPIRVSTHTLSLASNSPSLHDLLNQVQLKVEAASNNSNVRVH